MIIWPGGPIPPGGRTVRGGMRLRPEIRRVFEQDRRVYGARKVWRQLHRRPAIFFADDAMELSEALMLLAHT